MDRSNKMSETESEIMEVLWNSNAPMSASALMVHFSEHFGKAWKAQTLSTFLARLSQKGLITSTREGRSILYSPAMTRSQYHQSIAQGILDTMYQGSIKQFFAALYGDSPLSDQDREELRQWLDQETQP